MDGLSARIGFGCGRLRGRWEESNSLRLIDAALDSGITYFDTAPSYGGGASEKILGRALRGVRANIEIGTKIGLAGAPPGGGAALRGMAVAAARTVLPGRALNMLKRRRGRVPQVKPEVRGYGDFELGSVRSSLEKSLNSLQTDHVDCLLLHEPRKTDPTAELAEFLRDRVRSGVINRLGVGTYDGIEQLPAFGDVAQFALSEAAMNGGGARMQIAHGVLRDFDQGRFERCVMEEGVLEKLPGLGEHLRNSEGSSALLLNAVLFGTRIDRILVSTGSATRLRSFISSAKAMFEYIEPNRDDRVAATLANAARRYLGAKRAAGCSGTETPP
jgi:Aldo/keto reductase family